MMTMLKNGPTILQGYGVRLDIRNVEYKVFDDRRSSSSANNSNGSNSTVVSSVSENEDNDLSASIVMDDNGLYNVSQILAVQIRQNRTTMIQHHHPILAGVNVTKLVSSMRKSSSSSNSNSTGSTITPIEIMELQTKLWKIHDAQMVTSQMIPPVWQRRQLPMQVASVIVNASDPLFTFQYIIQNLPSVASTMVHVKVPELIVNATTIIEQNLRQSFQSGTVYLNGRGAISLDRPTFNVFELLKQIRDEQVHLQRIEALIVPDMSSHLFHPTTTRSKILQDIHSAWMMGRKFSRMNEEDDEKDHNNALAAYKPKAIVRIDVGRGWKKAVLYLNDIEKDAQYEMWPTSLRQMMMSMQYGMPPTVRRNIFTILCIMDPLQPLNEYTNSENMNGGAGVVENVGFNLGMQLLQASYPARIGLLIASEADIQNCLTWMLENPNTDSNDTNVDNVEKDDSCPVSPLFREPLPTKVEDLMSIPATTQAIHRLLVTFSTNTKMEAGAIISWAEYLFMSILDEMKGTMDQLTMYQLLGIYGRFFADMGAGTEAQGIQDGFQFLLQDESTTPSYSYGRSVRFAAEKRLKPGMSFMNGRPLPMDPTAGVVISTTFSEEQNHIFGLVMRGEITDSSPKSIYAKLLSGDGLYKKYHPLLSLKPNTARNVDENSPMNLDHTVLPSDSFLPAGTIHEGTFPTGADAYFVIDAFFHYHTQGGIDLMKMFINLMKSLPFMLDASSTGVMYRILPSSTLASKSALCPILTNAAHLGIPAIEQLLSTFIASDNLNDVSKLLDSIDGLSEDVRTTILASASGEGPCSTMTLKKQQHFSIGNTIVANGHTFPIEGNTIDHDDLELLLQLEIDRAKAVTNLLRPHIPFSNPESVDLVRKVAVFLMEEEQASGGKRAHINRSMARIATQLESNKNPLHFTWNTEESDESLQVSFHNVMYCVVIVVQLRTVFHQASIPIANFAVFLISRCKYQSS
jgi:UDP-glucose:glycoprotein glucosyltransferase